MTATATPKAPSSNGRPQMTAAERARLAVTVAAARADKDKGEAKADAKPAGVKPAKAKPAKKDAPAVVAVADEVRVPSRSEYTHEVKCCHVVGPKGKKCGAVRWCKPQDAFQVKRCIEHTKVYKRERAKARREAKAKTSKK
jgi:hypothetical protein